MEPMKGLSPISSATGHEHDYAKETYRHYRVGVDAGKKLGKEYQKGMKHGLKVGKKYSRGEHKMSDRIVEVMNGGRGGYGYGDCGMGGMSWLALLALMGRGGFGGWGGGWGGHGGFDGGHGHGGHHGGCGIPHIPEVKACGMNEVQHKQDFIQKEICDTRHDNAREIWAAQTAINATTNHAKDMLDEKFYDFTLANDRNFAGLNQHLCTEFRSLQNANNAEFRAIDKQFCGVKLEVAESTQKVLNAISASEIERLKEKVLALELRGREDREGHRAEGIKIDIANNMAQAQAQQQQQQQFQVLNERFGRLLHGFELLQVNNAAASNRTINVGGTMLGSGKQSADQANSNVAGY
jgi:hypothetical protein